jgi:hypothetical protein
VRQLWPTPLTPREVEGGGASTGLGLNGADLRPIADLLRQHRDDAPLDGLCIHAPALDYGTRSSLILRLGGRLEESQLLWADAPPCESPFADRSDLIRELVTPP